MLQALAILIGSIATVLYLLHYSVRGGRRGKLVNKIPGPHAWPFIGTLGNHIVPLEQLWTVLRDINSKYYPINRLWSLRMPIVNIQHPDDVEVLLTSSKHINKSLLYKLLDPWLGTGLVTSSGAKWHQRRKILTPAFHFGVLQQFVRVFIEQSDKLVESMCPDGEEVVDDLVSLLYKYTLNSICETAMGSTSDVDEAVLNRYRSCVSEMGKLLIYRLIRPWLHYDWSFRWSKKSSDQRRALTVLHGFSDNIISKRKQYHKGTAGQYLRGFSDDEGIYGRGDDHGNGKRRLAMLDLLISAQQQAKIDDKGIREEVDTFVFEGHDTTAMALCFALLLLAENKDIQDKARTEIDEVFGQENGGAFSIQEIQRLGYLERCIKESMRLFPSVPLISRHISEDLELKNHLVPGGTIVHVHIFDLHRDPYFWPNPQIFDPDRFLPEQMQGRHPFAFVPFSAGPRNCIGQKFAMLELKALVGKVLSKFYLEPIDLSSEVRFMPDLVLRPLHPIRIKFVRRSYDD